ncbi:MAG: hypothetical protein ABR584_03880 [Candidatus Baltobacteraceae bacterium]
MSNAITLDVFEEGPVFRAQCEYPVVHAVAESEKDVIAKAMVFIREMLGEAERPLVRELPTTLIVRTHRAEGTSVSMWPLQPLPEGPPDFA